MIRKFRMYLKNGAILWARWFIDLFAITSFALYEGNWLNGIELRWLHISTILAIVLAIINHSSEGHNALWEWDKACPDDGMELFPM